MIKPAIIPRHTDSNGWWESLPAPSSPRILNEPVRVRTAIVGAGICGVSVTHRLAELCPDEDICLIEAERVGYGASGRNAGFLLNLHAHGSPKKLEILRRNMRLWEAGLSSLRRKVDTYQIHCDWSEAGRFYGAAGKDGMKRLRNIAATLDALDQSFQWLDRNALSQRLGTQFYRQGLHVGGNALVNPAALMNGLAQHLPKNVAVYEQSPVTEVSQHGSGYKVFTAQGEVTADRLVLATGVFLRHFGIASTNVVPMATYGSLTAPLSGHALSAMGSGEEYGLLAGSENGATIRLTRDKRLFVRNYYNLVPGAPASHERVMEIARMHHNAMTARWPSLQDLSFEHSWGGIMAFTRNNGTVFGEYQPNLFAVLTNDVSPMTRGAAAGQLLAEYMQNESSDLLSLQLGIPGASRLPPRPLLDIGVSLHRRYLNLIAGNEF